MKEIRDVSEKLKNQLANSWRVRIPYPVKALEYQNQSVAEIMKIVLKWVGENYSRVRSLTDERIIWVRGYNQAKEEIKRKVEDDKKC